MDDNERKACAWIVGSDTGTSSKTIWAVMMGVVTTPATCGEHNDYDVPLDVDDFSRCHQLFELIPSWRERIGLIGEMLPKWRPFVANWSALSELYLQDKYRELYKRLSSLYDEGMACDGWIMTKSGKGFWRED